MALAFWNSQTQSDLVNENSVSFFSILFDSLPSISRFFISASAKFLLLLLKLLFIGVKNAGKKQNKTELVGL